MLYGFARKLIKNSFHGMMSAKWQSRQLQMPAPPMKHQKPSRNSQSQLCQNPENTKVSSNHANIESRKRQFKNHRKALCCFYLLLPHSFSGSSCILKMAVHVLSVGPKYLILEEAKQILLANYCICFVVYKSRVP